MSEETGVYLIDGELIDDILFYIVESRSNFPSGDVYNLINAIRTLSEVSQRDLDLMESGKELRVICKDGSSTIEVVEESP